MTIREVQNTTIAACAALKDRDKPGERGHA